MRPDGNKLLLPSATRQAPLGSGLSGLGLYLLFETALYKTVCQKNKLPGTISTDSQKQDFFLK
jgi:hypothetical protein